MSTISNADSAGSYHAERGFINVAGSSIECYMLPSGEYRYAQRSAAEALGLKENDSRMFISSPNADKYIEPEEVAKLCFVQMGKTRVKAWTDKMVAAYWQWKADNGNIQAKALLQALATEALYRRSGSEFGVVVAEEVVNQRTTNIRQELVAHMISLQCRKIEAMIITGDSKAVADLKSEEDAAWAATPLTAAEEAIWDKARMDYQASPEFQERKEARRQELNRQFWDAVCPD